MVRGMYKSRTFRRVHVRTPGGKNVIHYKKRKPSHAICSTCKDVLKGVPRERPYKIKKLSKTQRRPDRPFGGVLCGKCMKDKIKIQARVL